MILQELDDEIPPPMVEAEKQAQNSKCRFKLGAVVSKKNRIIGKGFNSKKTHPIFGSGRFKNLHAEGHALYRAINRGHDVSGCTVYVYRRNGNLAKPCTHCQKLLKDHGIHKVIYTA